ncbi:hypothetical protein Hanom_Chr04g00333601 [Helianthus anomalus]
MKSRHKILVYCLQTIPKYQVHKMTFNKIKILTPIFVTTGNLRLLISQITNIGTIISSILRLK